MKKVIILGKGPLSIYVADYFRDSKNWELVFVVPEIPEPSWTESFNSWAIQNKISTKKYQDLISFDSMEFDLGVSIYFSHIFTDPYIDKFRKLINIHNAPLPKYRGVNPVNWALKNGEKNHGVTIHKIEAGIDSGPILNQVFFPIDANKEEVEDVYRRCLLYAKSLFLDTIERLDTLIPVPQNDEYATYFSKGDFELLGDRKFFKRTIGES